MPLSQHQLSNHSHSWETPKGQQKNTKPLTKSRRHLFSRMAPQQPRKPSRKSIAPIASMMYAPVKSRGLAATISRKPVGSTMTQIPTPSRHAPPSCHGTRRGERGRYVNIKQQLQENWINYCLLVKGARLENLCFFVAYTLHQAGDCQYATQSLSC